MPRNLAVTGESRPVNRCIGSLACLAFVVLLALAFWAGALWLGQILMRLVMS